MTKRSIELIDYLIRSKTIIINQLAAERQKLESSPINRKSADDIDILNLEIVNFTDQQDKLIQEKTLNTTNSLTNSFQK
jgi:hypothetical protein